MDILTKIGIPVGILLAIALVGSLLFRLLFVTYVENYELPIEYNAVTGQFQELPRQGYFVRWPFIYSINTIDTRPTQVSINANSRVLNAKLVEFNPKGWRLFFAWHGRKNYSNDVNLNEILKSYAYDGSGKSYPFLHIIKELKADEEKPVLSKTDSLSINVSDTLK